MPEKPSLPIVDSPKGVNGSRSARGARRERPGVGSKRVDDFVPIEEQFEQAGSVFISGGGSWLRAPAAEALAGSDGVTIAFGEAQMVGSALVVALHWAAATGPCATLYADLRLEPMPAARSHLSLSGRYEVSSSEADGNDATTCHHLTESCVRCFLVGVAVTLERARPEYPAPPSGQRAADQGSILLAETAPIRQRTGLPTIEHLAPSTKEAATRREL